MDFKSSFCSSVVNVFIKLSERISVNEQNSDPSHILIIRVDYISMIEIDESLVINHAISLVITIKTFHLLQFNCNCTKSAQSISEISKPL